MSGLELGVGILDTVTSLHALDMAVCSLHMVQVHGSLVQACDMQALRKSVLHMVLQLLLRMAVHILIHNLDRIGAVQALHTERQHLKDENKIQKSI